jgi:Cu/Ag efflux pump CusA
MLQIWHRSDSSPLATQGVFYRSRGAESPPFGAERALSAFSDDRAAGTSGIFGEMDHDADGLSVDQSPGAVSSGDLVLQSGARGAALGQATAAITAAEAQMNMPATVIGTFQGNAHAFQTSLASEPYLIATAIVVIYIILGVLYESYIHPLTILSTLPSAALGALVVLRVVGFDFSLIALIGVLLLMGIVKKNGIMLVDFAIEAERHRGLDSVNAVREACLLRFRPIIMTTMAAMLGGVPLMLGTGTGSEIRQPLGFAIVGGLIVSQALTLYTTPVVYLYLDQLGVWLGRHRSGAALSHAPSAAE